MTLRMPAPFNVGSADLRDVILNNIGGAPQEDANNRSRKMKLDLAIHNEMSHLPLRMLRSHHMRKPIDVAAQCKHDKVSEHYEFNWCLRSPAGGRLVM